MYLNIDFLMAFAILGILGTKYLDGQSRKFCRFEWNKSTLIAQGHFGYTFLHQKQNKSLGNKGQNCPFLGFQSRQSSKANKIDL